MEFSQMFINIILLIFINICFCKLHTIDNGVVTIGIDTDYGGAITFFADDNSHTNVINCHDFGREVQMSFYSGPNNYDGCTFMDQPWPWNPIGCGDRYGHVGTVLEVNTLDDGNTLYVKSLPLQWACNNVPCECIFEKWISLDNNAAWIKSRLTMNRTSDKTEYGKRDQELPAVYSNGFLYHVMSYVGSKPWTKDKISELPNHGPPWNKFSGTENWAAMMADNQYGFGVYNPNCTQFLGGFVGQEGKGGSKDPQAGYIAPIDQWQISWNDVKEYQYALVLGYIDDIRNYVYSHRKNTQ